jgi:hypothetical protein
MGPDRIAVMRTMDEKSPGSNRFKPLERFRNPIDIPEPLAS